MTITYGIKDGVYVNLTNRCPCACTFCLRANGDGVGSSPSLWLEREPSLDEVVASLEGWDWTHPGRECVFCGYGEPTERLETLLSAAAHMRSAHPGVPIRVNTNGLADLIAGEPTAARFAGLVDTMSISLNTDDPAEYMALCRPKFGAAAYPAMLRFAAEVAKVVPRVVMTVVGEPVTPKEKQERCRAIAESLGATLRVRRYEG
ncbi:MAG: TatD family nuclease-associated radical SAM protein [Kiritimatiellae bacterium]|nr:TatD family nuclease-associated radical SAM protein [Kiritimatiellia bacterium]